MHLKTLVLFPALAIASLHLDLVDKRCDGIATLTAPVTVTSLLPTQTLGLQPGDESSCSITYTTVLPSLAPGSGDSSPGGLRPHTYTITYGCAGTDPSPCQLPESKDICPPGFVRTTTVCDTCGNSPVTYTLTVPDNSPATAVTPGGNRHLPGATASPPKLGERPVHCGLNPCPQSDGPTGDSGYDDASQPETDNDESRKYVEISAGGSGKILRCLQLAEAVFVSILLAMVNMPL